MHRLYYERRNIVVSFAKRLIFPEKILPDFYKCTLGRQRETKIKILVSGHYALWKCYTKGVPRKKQYHCFFQGAPKSSRKKKRLLHTHFGWILANQDKKLK